VSENSEFEAEKQPSTEPAPAVEGDSGQYVEGDYGAAGAVPDEAVGAVEGEYPDGSYGAAGDVVGETAGAVEGEYESGDYGDAGTVGENLVTAEDAEYPDGDYGAAGIADAPATAGAAEEHRLVEDEVPVEEETQDEDLPGD
jgi:hypothetical protein